MESKDAFSHIDHRGMARMVDVSGKPESLREAVASGRIIMGSRAFELLADMRIPKGDVFAAARIAGIMAAKKVDSLIPLCHSLPLHSVEIEFLPDEKDSAVEITARVKTKGVTGVEMEAMIAVSVAALTIYDMCKAVTKEMTIEEISLDYKSGGKSGTWQRKVREERT
ncbi:MAG TPA: cyclic pyranopterin monophosphate synthase MoaC [Thermodesulfobacteriaceae bacterium]|nr:cyclic pyranopterin monophosphate synthase MoaC [Thermodesulfobacteriaceae bacterium]